MSGEEFTWGWKFWRPKFRYESSVVEFTGEEYGVHLFNRWKVAELSSFILRINCFLNQIHTMRMECTLPWIYACLEVEFYWWWISPSQMCAPWNHSNKMDGFLKQSYYYCTAYNTIHIYPKPYVHTSTFTNEYDYYSFERLVFSLFLNRRHASLHR